MNHATVVLAIMHPVWRREQEFNRLRVISRTERHDRLSRALGLLLKADSHFQLHMCAEEKHSFIVKVAYIIQKTEWRNGNTASH